MTTANTLRRTTSNKQFVYLVREGRSQFCKVGITNNMTQRLKHLQCGNPRPLTPIAVWHVADAATAEETLHEALSDYAVQLEWFKLPTAIMSELKSVADLDAWLFGNE